ncbi:glutathione S-transferase C-terminal domain-containing protein [Pseudomonas sp. PCH446]
MADVYRHRPGAIFRPGSALPVLGPESIPYAINRYRREAERHYRVLDRHLTGRRYIVGDSYTIADISAWGWIDRAARVLKGEESPLAAYPTCRPGFSVSTPGRPWPVPVKWASAMPSSRSTTSKPARPVPLELSRHHGLTEMPV